MTGTNRPLATARTRRGISLLEIMIAVTLFVIVMVVINGGIAEGMRAHTTAQTVFNLEQEGQTALSRMVAELRGAGIAENPAAPGQPLLGYPFIWQDNNPPAPYDGLVLAADRLPVDTVDDPLDPAGGPSSSIVFVVPISDGTTLDDDAGTALPLFWDPDPADPDAELAIRWGGRIRGSDDVTDGHTDNAVVYRLVRHGSGDYNVLERFERQTGETDILCAHVERLVFEYWLMGGIQRRNQVRIRLYMRRRDDAGHMMRADLSVVVAMRSIKAL